jgi:hypothetical protein
VDVTQLLYPLALTPDIEIIEALLPDRMPSFIPLRLAGESLFDHLHHARRIADFRFRDEQMKMFWHDDISVDDEAVLAAGFFQNFQEEVAAAGTSQMRLTVVAATGNEV